MRKKIGSFVIYIYAFGLNGVIKCICSYFDSISAIKARLELLSVYKKR